MKKRLSPASLETAEDTEGRNRTTFPGILAKRKFRGIFDRSDEREEQ